MGRRSRHLAMTLAVALAVSAAGAQPDAAPADVAFADLVPILQARCVMCHGAGAASAGLRLDDLEALRAGALRGPVVIAGDPDASELVRRLRGDALPRMPLTGPPYLDDGEIGLFVRWIAAGAGETDAGDTGGVPDDAAGGPGGAAGDPPVAGLVAPAGVAPEPTVAGTVGFARVETILALHCVRCHTGNGVMGPAPEGYRLDSYAEALRADDRARIVAFAPEASELVRRIRGHAIPRMPLGSQLAEADIDLIVAWIADGARDAAGVPAALPVGADVRLHGTWLADGTLDGLPLDLSAARVDDDVRPGAYVQVRALLAADGRLIVERVRGR